MAITVTSNQVQNEGQFQLAYFPRCVNTTDLDNLIEGIIDRQTSALKQQVGSNWDTTDSDEAAELTDALLFRVLARCWHIILNVMLAYDEESLPPEYVEPERAAAQRDYYRNEADEIVLRYEATPGTQAYVGAFDSVTVDEDDSETILGLTY